jgi:hypothetical protein
MAEADMVPIELIERAILLVRGQRVLLDTDLAVLYGVEAKVLNQSVKRNIERFPEDFMIRLTAEEATSLRSRIVTLESGRGRHRKYLPHAFTEQGVAMLSSVLRSTRAVQVNIEIMRAFVRIRRMSQYNADLTQRLDAMESSYDVRFKAVFEAIRRLMIPPDKPIHRIGFGRKPA